METLIGKVSHFYNRISVAVVDLQGTLKSGDLVHFLGHTTDFIQRITSIEVEHHKITSAEAGMEIALKVEAEVRSGDAVFMVDD